MKQKPGGEWTWGRSDAANAALQHPSVIHLNTLVLLMHPIILPTLCAISHLSSLTWSKCRPATNPSLESPYKSGNFAHFSFPSLLTARGLSFMTRPPRVGCRSGSRLGWYQQAFLEHIQHCFMFREIGNHLIKSPHVSLRLFRLLKSCFCIVCIFCQICSSVQCLFRCC